MKSALFAAARPSRPGNAFPDERPFSSKTNPLRRRVSKQRQHTDAAQQRNRFERNAQRFHAVIGADGEEFGEYGRMKVIVLVRVDMVEDQPRRPEGFELRANLGPNLAAHGGTHHDRQAIGGKVGAQTA